MFGSERSAKPVVAAEAKACGNSARLSARSIMGGGEDRAICDRRVNDIIKRSVVKVKRCERPSDLEVSGHSAARGRRSRFTDQGL